MARFIFRIWSVLLILLFVIHVPAVIQFLFSYSLWNEFIRAGEWAQLSGFVCYFIQDLIMLSMAVVIFRYWKTPSQSAKILLYLHIPTLMFFKFGTEQTKIYKINFAIYPYDRFFGFARQYEGSPFQLVGFQHRDIYQCILVSIISLVTIVFLDLFRHIEMGDFRESVLIKLILKIRNYGFNR